MGWSLGFDQNWNRWIGYGVPAYCDHPDCNKQIDRGLAYVCCAQEPYGGERGCGLYFCAGHANGEHQCERCVVGKEPFAPKGEHPLWINHLLTDRTWSEWRRENPAWVSEHSA